MENALLADQLLTRREVSDGKESRLGSGSTITGALRLSGRSHLDGRVEGEIFSEGELIIGETAHIEANIQGQSVQVFGAIIGDITCTARLELHSGARVRGNISTPSLVIHDGVVFEGSCSMRGSEPQVFELTAELKAS